MTETHTCCTLHDELLEALKKTAQTLAWQTYGECRGYHETLPTTNEALALARAIITKAEGKT